MKKILLLLTLVITALLATSCKINLKPPSGDPPEEFTVYSPDVKVSLVLGSTDATDEDRRGYNTVRSAITSLIPGGYLFKTDEYNRSDVNPSEIVVGHTSREISDLAYEYLDGKEELAEGYSHFVIYCHDGAVAIAGDGKYAMDVAVDYFLNIVVNGQTTLVLDYDLVDYVTFSVASHEAMLDAKYDAEEALALERRWEVLAGRIGAEATAAVRALYDYYGTEWLTWLANLYDPATGCFYYSNSARDYDTVTYTKHGYTTTYQLLPDAESTHQAIDMLQMLGLFEKFNNSWIKALPEDMRVKCLAYIQNMQSNDDGYFYHPQWGKNIGDARRGRDLSSCLGIIRKLGGTPLYKTATERLEEGATGASLVISAFMESDLHKSSVVLTASSLPAHLQSEEALKNYIDRICVGNTCHGVGHILSSQAAEIKAAGLAEFCISYIDTFQVPETGYFYNHIRNKEEHEYDQISAIIKISALYSGLGGRMKYMDKIIDSAIETICSDFDPVGNNICFVYNAWGGLGAAISNVAANNDPYADDNTNVNVVRAKVFARFPEMIEATIKKLDWFREGHPDKSFSFHRDGTSLIDNQGVYTSRGYVEGDVNATTVAIYYTINGIFSVIGVHSMPLLTYKDYREFIGIINEKIEEAK